MQLGFKCFAILAIKPGFFAVSRVQLKKRTKCATMDVISSNGATSMKKTIGILAHVDAGKTTFSEQVLYRAQAIRALGRVDHGDAFLDTHPLERQRGITIFSDQAYFERGGDGYFWVDTPGHVDFSAEMERAVSIMDYAVLVVSAAEGVQSHTESIWTLLKAYNVPVFVFVNKMDRAGADLQRVLAEMRKRLSTDAVCLDSLKSGDMDEAMIEAVAERDEALLERYYEGEYDREEWLNALKTQIRTRAIFPVVSGSALKGEGVDEFMDMLCSLTEAPRDANAPFRAQIYKIRHDAQGERICFFKVLSGSVPVRGEVMLPGGKTAKIGELRRYHGAKYKPVPAAEAGDLVAAMGLEEVKPGDMIGEGANLRGAFHSEPMMAVSVLWDRSVHTGKVLGALRQLEDEEPTLAVMYSAATGSIDLHVMGPIQLEVIRQMMHDRYALQIDFGPMRVLYMETIAAPAVGIGHYEPLRHYAEVHLRLVPGERGSGVKFVSRCHVDDLALNWQRLIETHVFEKTHKGVLTGAPLTDVTFELLCGRAHLKHTEGGDFRESTYRAIRNALMQAENVLLEPICRFELRAPGDCYGRVLGDLTRLHAQTEAPEMDGETFSLSGEAAFADFAAYHADFLAATHGRGILNYRLDHYAPCRNAEQVIESAAYNPLADDTPDSVFCAHGAGFVVPWDQVKNYAHLKYEEKR